MDWSNKKVLIVGLKSSGLSAYELLKNKGAILEIYDDDLTLSFKGKTNLATVDDISYLKDMDCVVVSPSISNTHRIIKECKRLGINIFSELSIGFQELKMKTVAVTGTNGKTTTTMMIESLINYSTKTAKATGNIGYPVSQLVDTDIKTDYAIVETSSFQLEYGKISPDIAIILNIAPDHMDRYDSFSSYANTKINILRHLNKGAVAIVGDDENILSRIKKLDIKPIIVSTKRKEGLAYIKDNYFFYQEKPLTSVKDFKPKGEHNRFNALVALTVGALLNIPPQCATTFIRKFKLPPHRIEYIATLNGKSYYNDSKGTNLHATRAAIDMIDGDLGLIMGGSDKNEEFCDFFMTLPDKVKRVAVTGANSEKILSSAFKVGYFDIIMHPSLESALDNLAKDGQLNNVLFSPSSASFDRYLNYEERGNAFKELVFKVQA